MDVLLRIAWAARILTFMYLKFRVLYHICLLSFEATLQFPVSFRVVGSRALQEPHILQPHPQGRKKQVHYWFTVHTRPPKNTAVWCSAAGQVQFFCTPSPQSANSMCSRALLLQKVSTQFESLSNTACVYTFRKHSKQKVYIVFAFMKLKCNK